MCVHSEYLEYVQLGTASGRRGSGFSVQNVFTKCFSRSHVAIYQQLMCKLVRMKTPLQWQQWKLKKKVEKIKLKE